MCIGYTLGKSGYTWYNFFCIPITLLFIHQNKLVNYLILMTVKIERQNIELQVEPTGLLF